MEYLTASGENTGDRGLNFMHRQQSKSEKKSSFRINYTYTRDELPCQDERSYILQLPKSKYYLVSDYHLIVVHNFDLNSQCSQPWPSEHWFLGFSCVLFVLRMTIFRHVYYTLAKCPFLSINSVDIQ